ncbi:sensor histidine kinase [Algoriphagus sp. NG3]|uniref:sensor histidine kinase n=1 Tax=unclassified Algoriphagus TaxID=2641541 RepID=UPI002A81EE0D|nr:sensor histidine kinase [Algoriphagus sp. NG3]WPR73822.1 sensor histidine kinase [Algoriphagus sp. NG3]
MEQRKLLKGIVHLLIIGVLLSQSIPSFSRPNPGGNVINISLTNINLVLFYILNIAVLIPKYIEKRSYHKYFVSVLILLLASLSIHHLIDYYLWDPDRMIPIKHQFSEREFIPKPQGVLFPLPPFFFRTISFTFRYFLLLGLGTAFEVLLLFDNERTRNDEMEKQKAIGELNFLKTQLNPHFLLNALNNIYALARKKSEDTTNAILLLSDILRHVLYEAGKSKIPIKQEIDFIHNYIKMEKLKFTEENAPNINFNVNIQNKDLLIEPLILMTLVENAFKHGVSYLSPSFILISLEENERELKFSVINSIAKKFEDPPEKRHVGLGIKNLENQMELIYPGKYSFRQKRENNLFKSFLTIKK